MSQHLSFFVVTAFCDFVSYLLSSPLQAHMKSVNDVMPMIGARFYTQLDAAQVKCDVLEGELAKVRSTAHYFKSVILPFFFCITLKMQKKKENIFTYGHLK